MSGFKLLAIRPLKGCSKDFRKVLNAGTIYSFYNDYRFIRKDDKSVHSEVVSIEYKPSIPDDFFNTNGLSINISAIVGKNGSGKSTLIDLFFAAIHVASAEEGVLKPNLKSITSELKDVKRQISHLVRKRDKILNGTNSGIKKQQLSSDKFNIDDDLTSILKNFSIIYWDLSEKIDKEQKKLKELNNLKDDIQRLNKGVKVEIFYELDGNIFRLTIGGKSNVKNYISLRVVQGEKNYIREDKLNFLLKNDVSIDFNNLFYTIAISYSHYALNAKEIGPWINSLFHKNDGYQTPIVINPMRRNGIIDVNKEKVLVNQRLLSNLLEPIAKPKKEESLRLLAPRKVAKKLILTINYKKIDELDENKRSVKNASEVVGKLYLAHTGKSLPASVPTEPAFVLTELYLTQKLIKICEKYVRYEKYLLDDRFDDELVADFVDQLINDSSHITFKLKQALNFLRFKVYWSWKSDKKATIDLNTYSNHIKELKKELKNDREQSLKAIDSNVNYLTIEFVPPSIFDIEIIMEDDSSFNGLSSGEKQRVYSLSTIAYHIMNINSIFDNGEKNKYETQDVKEIELIKYSNVNILFDEVEQYFHPDFQRQFVEDLLSYIGKLNPELIRNLSNINILFATHSPFILSDIPVSNTLRIDDGNVEEVPTINTFGANIYDLLADNFFMKEGFVGSFAMKKISEALMYIYDEKFEERKNENFEKLAKLISDEIISDKLLSLLFEKKEEFYSERSELEKLTIEKARIDERINKIKSEDDKSRR